MKVLVTGGAGYIGVVMCERLVRAGHSVRIVDRLYWGRAPLEQLAGRVEVVHADVRTIDDGMLAGIEAVVHLAGLSNDPTAEYQPDANWEMNALATASLAAACRRVGIQRFTFGSSASIYDGLGDGNFDETTKVEPRGAYSRSKFAAEQALLQLADERFAPVILRQGTVYGFSPRMRFDLVVNTFIKDALLRGKLFLHGGGWMWRPLVDIHDVAEAHLRCLEEPSANVAGQIFNVVHQNFQIRQLAMLVSGSLSMRGRTIALEDAPVPAISRDYRCSNRKLHDVVQFTPHTSVLESIEGILERFPPGDSTELAHPRYYNIQWMTLLEQVWESRGPFTSVWSAQRSSTDAPQTYVAAT